MEQHEDWHHELINLQEKKREVQRHHHFDIIWLIWSSQEVRGQNLFLKDVCFVVSNCATCLTPYKGYSTMEN